MEKIMSDETNVVELFPMKTDELRRVKNAMWNTLDEANQFHKDSIAEMASVIGDVRKRSTDGTRITGYAIVVLTSDGMSTSLTSFNEYAGTDTDEWPSVIAEHIKRELEDMEDAELGS